MRIPFDSICVAASVTELQAWLGAKAQRWVQVSPRSIAVQLYWQKPGWLWISWDQEFGRITLGPTPSDSIESTPFLLALKKQLDGDRLDSIKQVDRDRIARLTFHSGLSLFVEMMGRHGNAILVEAGGKQVAAAKWVGAAQSIRPVLPGKVYESPPTDGSLSPFIKKFPERLAQAEAVFSGALTPFRSANGIYPIALGLVDEIRVPSFAEAAGEWFAAAESGRAIEHQRSALHAQLIRIATARREAVESLTRAADHAARAAEYQMLGELILAYGFQSPGAAQIDVTDYAGVHRTIALQPDLTPPQNAEKWFRKARRAKDGIGEVRDQLVRQTEDLEEVERLLANLPNYESMLEIEKARQFAESRHWLHKAGTPLKKEERPFSGYRVKELAAPHGYTVFYGENAEANDYLTMRMGKPNDIWMHVRGNTSAHVLIPTHNRPDRVPHDVLMFGAEVSARHSPLKNSSMVPVDYTLKKYVRRPRGSAKGFVTYTNEKTLHVT
ncbi:MAG: NFACT family protein [Chthonomonas sp.]|nr:NFACT family protein [Chthonomonas sp.]